jgi:molecular chaperone GrpE
MSESPPPALAGDAAVRPTEGLTPETIEAVLADFRSWLQQVPAPAEDGFAVAGAEEAVDLHTLVGQFIGLRHEVNLQTRAVRTQQEQNTETLHQLARALEDLERAHEAVEQKGESSQDEQLRPLLKALVDIADALGLARREIHRLQQSIWAELDQLPALVDPDKSLEATQSAPPRPGLWARWFRSAPSDKLPKSSKTSEVYTAMAPFPPVPTSRQVAEDLAKTIRQLLGSLITGYTMSLQRIERAIQQQGLEPMETTGQPFDPEYMEVMEAVADSGRPAGEVVEEVRPGYLWRGRVFRYAQVRVAKA